MPGRVLREEREQILDEWEAEVRRSGSASAALPRDQLRDDIPKFLDRIAEWLKTDSSDTSRAVDHETTGNHALHRLQHGVELRDLIHEFRLLRQVVLRHATRHEDSEELRRNLARFADAVDHAMTESVARYAEARDEAREMMLAILSHDLRNPLGAIGLAAAALLKAGRLNPPEARAVSRIARSADRIGRMISDLLDLARSRFGGKMPVKPEPIDLAEVAHPAVEELQLSHPERDVAFETHGNLRGRWDRERLAQLVSNLVANAIAHGHDPILVELRDHGGEVGIRVCNHGPPIPAQAIPTLFEPYRRGSQVETAGLGLGLFIVAEIVRAHGGHIAVESEGDETAFTVRLPRGS